MGTNFYLITADHPEECEENHIGKRSAAGAYCWTCRETLCAGGEYAVHRSSSHWHDACPKCGARSTDNYESAMRELGFHEGPLTKTGVGSCLSFTWAKEPLDVQEALSSGASVRDEYERNYTPDEFAEVLDDCPIRFTHLVGSCFS